MEGQNTMKFPVYVVVTHTGSLFGVFPDAYSTVKAVRNEIDRSRARRNTITKWKYDSIKWEVLNEVHGSSAPLSEENAVEILRKESLSDYWSDFVVSKATSFGII